MEAISIEELRIQYEQLQEQRPEMGFRILMQNIEYLFKKGIIVNEIISSTQTSFILRCNQTTPTGNLIILTIKCFMVNNYQTLSNSLEIFENQCDVKSLSEYISSYDTFYYNKEDEIMNFVRKGYFKHSIDSLYKMNSTFNDSGILSRFDIVRQWITQILEVLQILHERGIYHGGIKASNVFIDEATNKIRLTDFEFSYRYQILQDKMNRKNVYGLGVFDNQIKQTKNYRQFNEIYSTMILIYQMTFGFDNTYHQIQALQSGIPFDETEQFENPYDYDNNDYKYRILKLVNQIVAKYRSMKEEKLAKMNIFYIHDVITMERNLESFQNSPNHIANAFGPPTFNIQPLDLNLDVNNNQEEQNPFKECNDQINSNQQLSQEELLKQELIYQQQKSQEKQASQIQKEIYSNENCSLQRKIDVYKKLDFEKYEKHSKSQNNSNNSNSGNSDEKQNSKKNSSQFSPEKITSSLPLQPNEVYVSKQFQNWNNSTSNNNNNEQLSPEVINPKLKEEVDRIEQILQKQRYLSEQTEQHQQQLIERQKEQQQQLKQKQEEEINNQIKLQIQCAKEINMTSVNQNNHNQNYHQEIQPALALSTAMTTKGQIQTQNTYENISQSIINTIPSINIISPEENNNASYPLRNSLDQSNQENNQNQPQNQSNHYQSQSQQLQQSIQEELEFKEYNKQSKTIENNNHNHHEQTQQNEEKQHQSDEKYEDFWVLDFSHQTQVQRGDDDHPNKYKQQVNQIQYECMNNSTPDFYTQYHLNNPNLPPTNIQQTLLKQIDSYQQVSSLNQSQSQLIQQEQIDQIIKNSNHSKNNSEIINNNNNDMKLQISFNNIQTGNAAAYQPQQQQYNNNSYNSLSYSQPQQQQQQQPQPQTIQRYSNGNKMYEGQLINNQRNGYGILYNEQGNKIYEGEFKEDKFSGQGKEFYENGKLLHEGNYEEGYLNGYAKSYYINGNLCYEGSYLNGLCHGEGSKYDEQNILLSTGSYVNGKIVGNHKKFYPNGQVQVQAMFKNNKRDGKAIEYHSNGQVQFQGIYKNGKRIQGTEYDLYGNQIFDGEYQQEDDE